MTLKLIHISHKHLLKTWFELYQIISLYSIKPLANCFKSAALQNLDHKNGVMPFNTLAGGLMASDSVQDIKTPQFSLLSNLLLTPTDKLQLFCQPYI